MDHEKAWQAGVVFSLSKANFVFSLITFEKPAAVFSALDFPLCYYPRASGRVHGRKPP
jgi:hypothetical protein